MKTMSKKLCNSWGFSYSHYINSVGLSDGLALWWIVDIKLKVDFSSKNLIEAICNLNYKIGCCIISFVYSMLERS